MNNMYAICDRVREVDKVRNDDFKRNKRNS